MTNTSTVRGCFIYRPTAEGAEELIITLPHVKCLKYYWSISVLKNTNIIQVFYTKGFFHVIKWLCFKL